MKLLTETFRKIGMEFALVVKKKEEKNVLIWVKLTMSKFLSNYALEF